MGPAEEKPADPPAEGEAKPEGEAEKEPEKKEKKYEWVEVKKMKKRTKKTDLKIVATGAPGLSEGDLQKRMDEETAMQSEMREIIDTDEKKNDLEAYIFETRDKIQSGGKYGEFITPADKEKFESELMKAEDWLYDHEDGTKVQFIEKLNELKAIGDPVAWRANEH